MTTYRAVPRHEVEEPAYPNAYVAWLEKGNKGVAGTIDIANNAGLFGYIKPDQFPDQRVFFSYRDWPTAVAKMPLVGGRVMFDVTPQDYHPRRKPEAVNVRFIP